MENELSNTNYINGELLDWLDDEFAFESLKSSVQQKTKESNEIIGKIKANLIAEDNDEVKYVVNLSDEQKEAIKNGTLKIDSKDGELYAQFKENGKYGKKLSIKEEAQKQGFTQAEIDEAIQKAYVPIPARLEEELSLAALESSPAEKEAPKTDYGLTEKDKNYLRLK